MSESHELLTRALALSESERADLAQQLLLSLEPEPDDADFDQRWSDEIEARLSAVRSGTAIVSDWEDAAKRIRQALDARETS